jgi:hypothetical protein
MNQVWENAVSMGKNPASVEMDSGTIILNKDVFPKYDKFTQNFILQHEKGHFNLQTDDESKADVYALKKLYGKTNRSLKKSLIAISKFLPENDPRIEKLYKETLLIDWKKNGNKKALKELNIFDMNIKKSNMDTPFLGKIYNADGGNLEDTGNENENEKKENPINPNSIEKTYNVLGVSFNLTNLLLLLIAGILIFKKG